VATKASVVRSEVAFEAGYAQPEFALFRDAAALLHHLYARLQPHGLKLTDLRVERGAGNVAEQHVLFYLFDYVMTVRVRVERLEVTCASLSSEEHLQKFKAATVDLLQAVKDVKSELAFRAFAVASSIHVMLDGQSTRAYLAQFAARIPEGPGPLTGSGSVFYFGPSEDRLLSAITVDTSALVPDGLFVRVNGVWDASRVAPDFLRTGTVDAFVRRAHESLGLQLPA
jgi:hypothetical protein